MTPYTPPSFWFSHNLLNSPNSSSASASSFLYTNSSISSPGPDLQSYLHALTLASVLSVLATSGHGQQRGGSLVQGKRCPSSPQEILHSFQEKPHKTASLLLFSEWSTERRITHRTLVFRISTVSAGLKPPSLENGKQPDPSSFWTLPKNINPTYKTWLLLILKPAGWIPEGKIGKFNCLSTGF